MLPLNLANRVTLLRMAFIPVFLVVLLGEWASFMPHAGWWEAAKPWAAAIIFVVLAVTDAVDGYLARSRNEVTTFGKLIDPLADKLLVAAALVALVDLDRLPSWVALVIISREFIVTGLRMVAVAEGKVIAAAAWGKAKTVTQIVAIVMFIVKDSPAVLAVLTRQYAPWFGYAAWAAMFVALVLTIWSMVGYFQHARDVLTGPWSGEKASS